jgi:hypothetical protein
VSLGDETSHRSSELDTVFGLTWVEHAVLFGRPDDLAKLQWDDTRIRRFFRNGKYLGIYKSVLGL